MILYADRLRWFSGEMGFVADNVINYEVVLASGEIVNANEKEHADLWQALKGGSNNFGIVTRFDIRAAEHDQQVYGGLVIVPASLTDEVLPALYNFTDDSAGIHKSAGLTVEYYIDTVTGDEQILLWLIDTDVSASHESLQPFFDMEPKFLNQVYQTSIADYPTSITPVSRVLMADAAFVNDMEALKAVYEVTMDIKRSLSHVPDLVWDFQFDPLPRHIIEASNARGGNVLGLENVTEDMQSKYLIRILNTCLGPDLTSNSRFHHAAMARRQIRLRRQRGRRPLGQGGPKSHHGSRKGSPIRVRQLRRQFPRCHR